MDPLKKSDRNQVSDLLAQLTPKKQYIPTKERGAVLNPHLWVLGAGASLAAAPDGDATGKTLPLLRDLSRVIGIADEVKRRGLEDLVDDFEGLYSFIFDNPAYVDLRELAEERVLSYFAHLRLPDRPTVYDYLVLGLRQKDLIATFNWDPFLIQAYRRNFDAARGRLPYLCFLHGNVWVATCGQDQRKGRPGAMCGTCGGPLEPSKLLFPVERKNYNDDPFVKAEWDQTTTFADIAYIFTVFGYSAPKTDIEARALLKSAWTSSKYASQSELEIIDVKSEDELDAAWDEFQFSHHFRYHSNFADCLVHKRPRRSCELLFSWLLDVEWTDDKPYPDCGTLEELHDWIAPLIEEELAYEGGENCPCELQITVIRSRRQRTQVSTTSSRSR